MHIMKTFFNTHFILDECQYTLKFTFKCENVQKKYIIQLYNIK